jgi:hypothetical protein
MLHTNAVDFAKLEAAVLGVLTAAKDKGVKFAFVNTRRFYESCKFSHFRSINLQPEVSDLLSGMSVCDDHGIWLFTELGDGLSVFIQMSTKAMAIVDTDELIRAMVAEGKAVSLHCGTRRKVSTLSEGAESDGSGSDEEGSW